MGDNRRPLAEFSPLSTDDRIEAFIAAYHAMDERQRAHIDEALCIFIERVKMRARYPGDVKFSQRQALELLGTIAVFLDLKGWDEVLYVANQKQIYRR